MEINQQRFGFVTITVWIARSNKHTDVELNWENQRLRFIVHIEEVNRWFSLFYYFFFVLLFLWGKSEQAVMVMCFVSMIYLQNKCNFRHNTSYISSFCMLSHHETEWNNFFLSDHWFYIYFYSYFICGIMLNTIYRFWFDTYCKNKGTSVK